MDFTQTKISIGRPLSSYSKIQYLYGKLIRNNRAQLSKLKKSSKRYLNIGCGPNMSSEFINIDYQWRPKLDLCWDITKGIPIDNNSLKGVYTEHCLEHISFSSCDKVIREAYRILKPGGVVRIIVPDAELYIDLYAKFKKGEDVKFPNETGEDLQSEVTPMVLINRAFRDHGHLFAYDYDTLSVMLCNAGFINVMKESYMKGLDDELLIDSKSRKHESLYVEAIKPA